MTNDEETIYAGQEKQLREQQAVILIDPIARKACEFIAWKILRVLNAKEDPVDLDQLSNLAIGDWPAFAQYLEQKGEE